MNNSKKLDNPTTYYDLKIDCERGKRGWQNGYVNKINRNIHKNATRMYAGCKTTILLNMTHSVVYLVSVTSKIVPTRANL